MKTIRVMVTLSVLLFSAIVSAQQTDWLIGDWSGALVGLKASSSPERFLTIRSVQPDGTATGGWSASADRPGKATIKLTGEELTVVTSTNARVQLKRDGDRLSGTFTLENGNSFPITLTKGSGSTAPAETFAGTVNGNSNCFAPTTQMEVTYRGNKASGFWEVTNGGKRHFSGEIVGDEFKTSVTLDPSQQVEVKGRKRGDTLDASFSSNRGCSFSGKLSRK